MSTILGIDPGSERSGWVLFDTYESRIRNSGTSLNETMLARIDHGEQSLVVIERVDPRGMPLGNSTRDTIEWSARFYERALPAAFWMPRRDVKLQLCGSARAKDGNVRAEVINRFGGDLKTAKGTKAEPGPLHGISGHQWQALACVIAWLDQQAETRKDGTSVIEAVERTG